MLIRLSLEYCLLVFVAVIGLLQAAASHNDLQGLLFFSHKLLAYLFAAVTLVPALYFFFTWNYRNATGVIEGSQQAGLFAFSSILALICTLLISSLIKRRYFRQPKTPPLGLDALRGATYWQALLTRIKGRN